MRTTLRVGNRRKSTDWPSGRYESFYSRKGFTLIFALIGIAALTVGALVIRDLHLTSRNAHDLQAISVREFDLIGELQYQAQEARRSMLYALTTTDSNLQVEYADQARAADARVAEIIQEDKRLGGLSWGMQVGERFERDWQEYLRNRDDVIALILEGSVKDAVQQDMHQGVPAFSRVRDDLQKIKQLNREQAEARLSDFETTSRRSLVKLVVILSMPPLLAAVAVRTIQKKMLDAVRQSETRLRDVIESINEGMFVVGEDGCVELWNRAAERNSRRTQADVLGRRLLDVFPELERTPLAGVIAEATRSKDSCLLQNLRFGDQTSRQIYEARIFPFDGGTTVFFDDVSERRQLEEQLHQSRTMEAVGTLAGGIAHDFNNLLTVITGYSQLTLTRLSPDDPLRGDIKEIEKAGERAASLTRQLLAFSRKQVLEPRPLDLNAVVADLGKMLRRLIGEDIELITVADPSLARVKADPGQVGQVIVNLAVNARDAMPRGGKLTIETANVTLADAYVDEHVRIPPGVYVVIAITDTGCGMDAETRSHIFEPFFTTKEMGKGTGLGLATVYGIIQQSGGHVWVYSEPGLGSIFKVYLPAAQDGVQSDKQGTARPVVSRGGETVLLVEDEDMARKLVSAVLQGNGYTVLEARHGGEAIQIGERHTDPIHLMLTDVIMPEMSGRELAERLCPQRPEMKVLYMSGYTDDQLVPHGVLDPGTAFLQKPFAPSTMISKVREVLDLA